MSSSSKAVAVGMAAGVAVLTAGLLYLLTRPVGSKKSAASEGAAGAEGEVAGNKPKLGKEAMIRIFERITGMMQMVVMNLAEHEQKVRMSVESRGKQISHEEMEQYLMTQFRQAMAEVEQTVYKENNTTEEEVRQATKYYEDDEDFNKTLLKLKRLFKAVTGQQQTQLPEVPKEVTMEKVLQIMSETMDGVNIVLESIHKELADSGLSPESTEFKAELQQRYLDRVGRVRAEVHSKHNISELLHAAVIKYQQVPSFQQELMKISNTHRARLEKLGFQDS
ncbi:Hypothetical Protein FCC1311_104592 [Hondaea fermentalgiana]|uniref:Uncharacterized protein n=1 Tax=Hondaea fermentalgiana TaxID=2315210 RepID=A0A2R5GUJ3_9STRA|nr:Hypothetical Protein FCC1311_104592 [Hondaea fermentalgiana]|eukprot:GBG34235.1 Hypothetical Protein FCC1311_104592 [Hondaea fermentalgiana]